MATELLRDLAPTAAGYLAAARRIEADAPAELTPVSVAVLATYTASLLRPYLIVEGARRGFLVRPCMAPFNQLEQQVLNPESELYAAEPEVVILATRLEELAPDLVVRFLALTPAEIEGRLAAVEQRIGGLLDALRRRTRATLLVLNYAPPVHLATGLADPSLATSLAAVTQRANERLAACCRAVTGAYVVDYARAVLEMGIERWYDPKLWYLGRVPFGADAQRALGALLMRYVRAARRPPAKCLVLDLDNTLWGGVLGEDGLGGIALGEDYPGVVYKDFHRYVLTLRDRGVLLAIASKNDEADALQALCHHPDSLLRPEHFAAIQIHWCDKAQSLTAIARELDIGIDALAFFDDNPAERAWIRERLPEVTVIEAPDSPIGFIRAIEGSGAFDHLILSDEDRRRSEMYAAERTRERLRAESTSLEEFLARLAMTVTIGDVDGETLPRVAQLLAKTNQFNLTTRRHSAAEVQCLIERGGVALWLRVRDRFGDNGLVGVGIVVPDTPDRWRIDTLLLSCRVIGREVERALVNALLRRARERGARVVAGEYIPTAKNGVVSDLYARLGFAPNDSDGRWWTYDLAAAGDLPIPPFLEVEIAAGHGEATETDRPARGQT